MMNKTEAMFSLVKEYRQSGISMRDFAAGKGIKLSTFIYWVRKKKQANHSSATGNFIPLNFKNDKNNSEDLEIVYPNGVRLVLTHFDIHQLHQLVKLY